MPFAGSPAIQSWPSAWIGGKSFSGLYLVKTLFCGIAETKAARLCPAHAIWHAIASLIRPGGILLPTFYGTNVNATTKADPSKLSIPHANDYSSHGFRRGAAQELKEKGSQRPIVMGVGFWRSIAFRGNVDVTLDVERDMSKLLVETDIMSDDEEVLPAGNWGT